MSEDRFLRADDSGAYLLDNDGNPLRELSPDSADALLDHGAALSELAAEERSWRFGHVIVDEAQDLTPMQWRMVVRRARGRSMTIVGDLAQRSVPTKTNERASQWVDVLPAELADHDFRELTINYRSPQEIARLAAAVLSEHAPGLTPGRAIRASGHDPLVIGTESSADESLSSAVVEAIAAIKKSWSGGRVAVIGASAAEREAVVASSADLTAVTWLDPWSSKGLEFDGVVIVEPSRILEADNGMSLLYVALTRSTDWLALVHDADLPPVLANALSA